MFHKYKCCNWQDRCVILNRDSFMRSSITAGGGHVLFKKWCGLVSLSASSLSLTRIRYIVFCSSHTLSQGMRCVSNCMILWFCG